ncbi:MAG: hypothetical protein ACLP7Q_23095 [Isosphaeraceae bacterium]
MTLNQFTQAIRRQPFRPFRLVLVDGREFRVDHPEFAARPRTRGSPRRRGREVTFYAGDNTQHFIDARLIAEVVTETVEEPAQASAPSGGE